MATITERIAAIDAILDRGLSSITDQDGRKHDYDLAALRTQRDQLQAQANGSRKPRVGYYNPLYPL